MIKGIGTDIVEVERIEKSLRKEEFKSLVFAPAEIADCDNHKTGSQRYAGRFAAKEALLKALGTGWVTGTEFNEIEVCNDEMGKPVFRFHGETKTTIEALGNSNIQLSISHTKAHATAFVVIEIIEK